MFFSGPIGIFCPLYKIEKELFSEITTCAAVTKTVPTMKPEPLNSLL
jgi:hypothetical protein